MILFLILSDTDIFLSDNGLLVIDGSRSADPGLIRQSLVRKISV